MGDHPFAFREPLAAVQRLRESGSNDMDHAALRRQHNRSGIIHVLRDRTGDVTNGNNVYDGRINTDLRINSNGVNRVYVLAAPHPAPRRVLVIGLSSGAWTPILSRMPGVEHIDVVEINPGYIEVIRRYAAVSAILDDSRITIHFDDGRRWLRRNSGAKYDMIVMSHLPILDFAFQLAGIGSVRPCCASAPAHRARAGRRGWTTPTINARSRRGR